MRLRSLLFMVIAVLAAFMLVTTAIHYNAIANGTDVGYTPYGTGLGYGYGYGLFP